MRDWLASYANTIALLGLVAAVLSGVLWVYVADIVFAFGILFYFTLTRDEPRGDADDWFV